MAQVVAVSHYKIAQVSDERTGILEHLEQRANCPEDLGAEIPVPP